MQIYLWRERDGWPDGYAERAVELSLRRRSSSWRVFDSWRIRKATGIETNLRSWQSRQRTGQRKTRRRMRSVFLIREFRKDADPQWWHFIFSQAPRLKAVHSAKKDGAIPGPGSTCSCSTLARSGRARGAPLVGNSGTGIGISMPLCSSAAEDTGIPRVLLRPGKGNGTFPAT